MVMTRAGAITLKGTPTDLVGPELKVGHAAPDFLLQNNALEEVSQDSFVEKTLIIATVPSLDTPVCHAETKKFNEQAPDLANDEALVVNPEGKLTYVEYVKEVAEHPNYDAALAAAKG